MGFNPSLSVFFHPFSLLRCDLMLNTVKLQWLEQATGPCKIVLAKGSSSHPGWILHKMTCKDQTDGSSQPR